MRGIFPLIFLSNQSSRSSPEKTLATQNNNYIRVVPAIITDSSWVHTETKNITLQNREMAVWDVLMMVFLDPRYYNLIPRKDDAIFIKFFYMSSVKMVQDHVWGSGHETVTFYSAPFDAKDKMPLASKRWIKIA